ncbi:FUSC family protein [Actinomadura sp. 7K507]|uniref:FUSC family protein n=1 Tax=Actinomadura sp. 7K507 TaxID=2530365 RepID=UPI00104D37BD|nr:FUSC family protein [Actinomadura sp. 7K507]TDC85744.1 FUSC family protein [Actinomadura sp. 7K507]
MREWLVRVKAEATPVYGLAVTLGLGLPLLLGLLTDRMGQGTLGALGAFLLAFGAPGGPYGNRARSLAVSLAAIVAGGALGGLLAGHPWATVAVLPVVVVLAASVPWIRPTAAMAVLLTSVRPPPGDPLENMLLMGLGGLWLALLLLSPWPARRLRPLDDALGRAAGSVAALLDTVAGDLETSTWTGGIHSSDNCGWERSRRHVETALRDATATSRYYRGEDEAQENLQPQQIIDTLRRIVWETVGLHTQIHVLVDRGPAPDPWRSDATEAIRGLAQGVRTLSTALARETAAPAAGPSPDLARHARGGDGAVLRQITHSVDRIDSALESARDELGDGLRLAPSVHWKRPRFEPGEAAAALAREVRERSPRFRHATRVAVLVTVAMAITAAFRLQHGQWMAVTVLVSLRDTYGRTVPRVVQRITGNAAGSMIAAVVLAAAPARPHVVALMLVFALAGFTLRSFSYTAWTVCSAPLLMMLMDLTKVSRWSVALDRVELVAAGGVIAALGARVLWPRGAARQVPARTTELLTAMAALTRAAASVLDGRRPGLEGDEMAAAGKAIDGAADAGTRLKDEPAPDTVQAGQLHAAVRAALRIRDRLIAVTDLASENADENSPSARTLDRLADALERTATQTEPDPPGRNDLDDPLAAPDDRPEPARYTLTALTDDVDDLINTLAKLNRQSALSATTR